MFTCLTSFAPILAVVLLSPSAQAFTFTTGNPTQCDDLSLSWAGGAPPYQLLLSPVFGTPRNISIPPSAFANGKGVFSFQLPITKDGKFLLTMSDATGFGTGGTTDVLVTGASLGGICNTQDPGIDFPFQLNSALQQCRPYVFSGYAGAQQPVTIVATVPGGTSIILKPPVGPTSFSWDANVAHGTSMLFMMFDAQGRNGGCSDVKTVGITNDVTCLNGNSPSSTAALATSTPTPTRTSATTPNSPTAPPSSTGEPTKRTSIAAIAGTVIGALVFLAVAITLGLFFLKRKRDSNSSSAPPFRRHSRHAQSEVDLTYDPGHAPNAYPHSATGMDTTSPMPFLPGGAPYHSNPFLDSEVPQNQHGSQYQPPSQYQLPSQYQPSSHYQASSQYHPSEYSHPQSEYAQSSPQYPNPPSQYSQPAQYAMSSQSHPSSQYQLHSVSGPDVDPFDPYALSDPSPSATIEPFSLYNSDQSTSRDSMSTAQRKAVMAGVTSYKPSRFIVHTDVEDDLPPPNEDGVVELPPQYSERRVPLKVVPTQDPLASHRPNPSLATNSTLSKP